MHNTDLTLMTSTERAQFIRASAVFHGIFMYELAAAVKRHPNSLWKQMRNGISLDTALELESAIGVLAALGRR